MRWLSLLIGYGEHGGIYAHLHTSILDCIWLAADIVIVTQCAGRRAIVVTTSAWHHLGPVEFILCLLRDFRVRLICWSEHGVTSACGLPQHEPTQVIGNPVEQGVNVSAHCRQHRSVSLISVAEHLLIADRPVRNKEMWLQIRTATCMDHFERGKKVKWTSHAQGTA
jgi:hypothetical protein